jgi:hypothetical protein
MAVGREGGAVECAILEQRLRDLPRLQIDDLNPLLAPAAEHDHGFVLFRREYEIDRQAAEVDSFAGGIESHTGWQRRSEERLPLGGHRRAQQRRKRESESTDTERNITGVPHRLDTQTTYEGPYRSLRSGNSN